MQGYGDNFIPVMPTNTDFHTPENSFCGIDPACPCYEDPDNVAVLQQAIADGVLTPEEASSIIAGKTV